MDEIWVLEFSLVQKAVHVSTLDEVVKCNKRAIRNNAVTGYMPVFVSKDEKEVRKCATALMDWRDSKFFGAEIENEQQEE